MFTHLIIDGYNIINKWRRMQKSENLDLEVQREKFNTIIQKYADYKNIKVTIVYDGMRSKSQADNNNPMIIFSQNKQSADSVIEYIVHNSQNPAAILVATDDNVQRNFIVTEGAWYISAQGLKDEVESTLNQMRDFLI